MDMDTDIIDEVSSVNFFILIIQDFWVLSTIDWIIQSLLLVDRLFRQQSSQQITKLQILLKARNLAFVGLSHKPLI